MVNFSPFSIHFISIFRETIPNFINDQNKRIKFIFFKIIEFLNPCHFVRGIWNTLKDLNNINLPNVDKVKEVARQKEPFINVPEKKEQLEKPEIDKPNEKLEPKGSKNTESEKDKDVQKKPMQEISKQQEKALEVTPQTVIIESKKADETTQIKSTNLTLLNYSQQTISKELSLTFPPLEEVDDKTISCQMDKIYTFCKKNPQNIQGDLAFTYAYDFSQKNVTIQTSQGEKKLNRVHITSYARDGMCVSLKWEFDLQNSKQKTYVTGREDPIPINFLNGLEFERIFPPMAYPVPQEWWDVWESVLPKEVMHYETIIYPQIVKTIQKICKLNPLIHLDIIDLGGGSGNLAETILKDGTLSSLVRKIVVIDSSSKMIEKAQKRAVNYPNRLIPKHISIEEMSNNLYNSTEYRQSAHIVILCGVVAHQVLSKKIGLDIVEKCQSILGENGIIIAASLSASLNNSTEYQKMGYNVLNNTFSFPLNGYLTTNDFYILQKKPSS